MIELKSISKNERYDLVRGCELFFITYKSPKWQNKIVKKLCDEFGEEYKIPIRVVLTAASKAKRYNLKGSMFSLDYMKFSKANSKTTKKIPYKLTKDLIYLMEEENYLTFYKGFKNKQESMASFLKFHDKLLDNLDKGMCDKWGLSRLTNFTPLEIVDSCHSTSSTKVYHSLKKFKGTGTIVEKINMVNKELSKHDISIKGESSCVVYKQRYEGNLNNGGRWYVVGTFQTESSELRNTIKIDQEPTVEIDICHIHPAILASIAGFKIRDNYDPYDITDYVNTPVDFKRLRNFIKPCFMALLYANNRGTALYTIRKKLKDAQHIANWLDAETILEALEDHNHMLSEFFYSKDNWKLCQFVDSQIATKIMIHFTSKGEVCLNYHDSWIVKCHHREELIQVIKDSWLVVVGNTDNLKYKIEFDNTPNLKGT